MVNPGAQTRDVSAVSQKRQAKWFGSQSDKTHKVYVLPNVRSVRRLNVSRGQVYTSLFWTKLACCVLFIILADSLCIVKSINRTLKNTIEGVF